MRITRAVVPSLFTVLNMFCGFSSIIHSHDGRYEIAAWLIILGAVFDSLDGVMARITKSSSKFGVEFDSLSDIITFGAAPSFLVYRIFLYSYGGLGVLISSMPLLLGGIRLARFNVQLIGFDKDYFKGLPIPSQALMVTTFVLKYYSESVGLIGWKADIFAPMIIGLSLLMVSTFKYDTLPKINKKNVTEHPVKFSLFFIICIAVLVSKGAALFPLFILYTLSGIFRWIINLIKNIIHQNKKNEEEDDAEISSIDV
jgi:CDP-diacylglycerol---serine O-phosphatidyltransferase